MLLQKPGSGVLIAFGMGLWFLSQRLGGRYRLSSLVSRLMPIVLWGLVGLLILSPYVVRNLGLFGSPFYSTESRDAWVIEYTDWENIYSVYSLKASPSKDELPSRSWVLRYGFDRAWQKMTAQVRAIRDYLLPPWSNLPLGLSGTLSGFKSDGDTEDSRLLFAMGAWLALLGLLGALRARRGLIGLLLAAFLPYALFLTGYWHADEERYFVMLLPWLALLAASALWRGYDRVAAIGDGRWTPVGLALLITALALVVTPSWPDIDRRVRVEPQVYAPDVAAYTWLRDHTPAGTVVMTRGPWQLNWQSQRPALMIPNTGDREVFLQLARYYNARYLVRDTLSNPSPQTLDVIDSLIEDQTLQEVYTSPVSWTVQDGRRVPLATEVYRFSETYGGAAALQP
jgi:hypothetical protein